MNFLPDILHETAARFPDAVALKDPREECTYAQLSGDVNVLAAGLQRRGLGPQSRSLVILPNSVNFIRAHFAVLTAGGISVPCDYGVTRENLEKIGGNCQPTQLITDEATLRRLFPDGLASSSSLRDVLVVLVGDPQERDLTQTLTSFAELRTTSTALTQISRQENEVTAILYTTGSTGMPKGVALAHSHTLAALKNICEFIGYTPDDREVVVLPLSHSFGLGHVYCNLMSGGAAYTEPGLMRIKRVLNTIESFGATGFPTTPMGIGMLIDRFGPILADKGRKLRFSVINSAPLPPERTAQLQELLPSLDIMVYYGLTEASRSCFISLTKMGPSYYRSAGQAMKNVRLRLRRADGSDAAVDEDGEVLISGPTVPDGYWNNPRATAESFEDGWLRTGDLGRLDRDGCLTISGRIKDLVNVGGHKVFPGEVEDVLKTFPGVQDAAVAGLSDVEGLTGETVVAGVVAEKQDAFDAAECSRFCVLHLEKYKVPARFVVLDQIPRAETGKIKRGELVQRLESALKAAC